MVPRTSFAIALSTTLCTSFLLTGCVTGFLKPSEKVKVVETSSSNPSARMVCIWQPAEGTGVDGKPSRGFAGQIFFFGAKDFTPVATTGDIRIQVFDDQGTLEEQKKPIYQFEFLGGSWQNHLRSTNLGPAYQIFIPYTRKGYHQARCSLRVKLDEQFEDRKGNVKSYPTVYSDMTTVELPGVKTASALTRQFHDQITPLNYQPMKVNQSRQPAGRRTLSNTQRQDLLRGQPGRLRVDTFGPNSDYRQQQQAWQGQTPEDHPLRTLHIPLNPKNSQNTVPANSAPAPASRFKLTSANTPNTAPTQQAPVAQTGNPFQQPSPSTNENPFAPRKKTFNLQAASQPAPVQKPQPYKTLKLSANTTPAPQPVAQSVAVETPAPVSQIQPVANFEATPQKVTQTLLSVEHKPGVREPRPAATTRYTENLTPKVVPSWATESETPVTVEQTKTVEVQALAAVAETTTPATVQTAPKAKEAPASIFDEDTGSVWKANPRSEKQLFSTPR